MRRFLEVCTVKNVPCKYRSKGSQALTPHTVSPPTTATAQIVFFYLNTDGKQDLTTGHLSLMTPAASATPKPNPSKVIQIAESLPD